MFTWCRYRYRKWTRNEYCTKYQHEVIVYICAYRFESVLNEYATAVSEYFKIFYDFMNQTSKRTDYCIRFVSYSNDFRWSLNRFGRQGLETKLLSLQSLNEIPHHEHRSKEGLLGFVTWVWLARITGLTCLIRILLWL